MRIHTDFSAAHLKPDLRPKHGPQTWPWWRLIAPRIYKLEIHPPSFGYRLWLYTRRGAVFFDLMFDRR